MSKYTIIAMTAVRLCSLNVWNGVVLALGEQDVRLYWSVFEFEAVTRVFNAVWGCAHHPDVLTKYTTMAMTAVRLCSSNAWNGVVLALLDEQAVRLYLARAWIEFESVICVRCS